MTAKELAVLMVSIMRIAGVQGEGLRNSGSTLNPITSVGMLLLMYDLGAQLRHLSWAQSNILPEAS